MIELLAQINWNMVGAAIAVVVGLGTLVTYEFVCTREAYRDRYRQRPRRPYTGEECDMRLEAIRLALEHSERTEGAIA